MRRLRVELLALLLLPARLTAQTDSALYVSSAGSQIFRVNTSGALVAGGTIGSGAIPATGSGARMMWFPAKAAFRAGAANSTSWDVGNVGDYSAGFGFGSRASGSYSTAGGYLTLASGDFSIAVGLNSKAQGSASASFGTGTASGNTSIALGNLVTASGDYSTAIGSHASTNGHPGAFVYADNSTSGSLLASADNEFAVRAAGGVRFFTSSDTSTGVTLAPGGGSWNTISDRNRKRDLLRVDGEKVLRRLGAVPVSSWRYLGEGMATRHIGPMAQDWHAAFGLNPDERTINSGDFDGVNLAAIQALAARTAAQQVTIDAEQRELSGVRKQNAALRARLDRLERVVSQKP